MVFCCSMEFCCNMVIGHERMRVRVVVRVRVRMGIWCVVPAR